MYFNEETIQELIKQHPNDQDLGKEIRRLATHSLKSEIRINGRESLMAFLTIFCKEVLPTVQMTGVEIGTEESGHFRVAIHFINGFSFERKFTSTLEEYPVRFTIHIDEEKNLIVHSIKTNSGNWIVEKIIKELYNECKAD